MGGTYIAEAWPESKRVSGGALMHTGYYFGILLAGVLNSVVGSRYGWRAMFAVGAAPALLVALVRYGVAEMARWREKVEVVRRWSLWQPFAVLFAREYRRRTLLNSFYMLVSITGLWAGSVYVPAAITAMVEPQHPAAGARSWSCFQGHDYPFGGDDCWVLICAVAGKTFGDD